MHDLQQAQVLVLFRLLLVQVELANVVVVEHAVAFLTLRVDKDLFLKQSLWERQVQELEERFTIIDKILLHLVHLKVLVFYLLELL